SRPVLAKGPAKPAGKAGKAPAKPSAAAAPPAPKVKFRGRVLENEPLARHTTYRIGGPARYLVMPADVDDVVKALELAQDRGLPEATVMDAKGKIRQVLRKQISFKYRSSNLGNVIVVEAKLALIEEPPAKLKELQARLLRWRKAGTPFDQPCAGSVFKNPGGP